MQIVKCRCGSGMCKTGNCSCRRVGKSCVTNLLSYYDRVAETIQERDGWVDSIYLDFKKAFDRVPHERLIWTLEYQGGVQGNILNWVKDFLVRVEK